VHVHAHGIAGTGVFADQTRLRLGYKRPWRPPKWRDVSTADVHDAADQMGSIAPDVGPLGFLNACAGGRGLQRGVDAFVDILLAYGYRAVIGPVVDVPSGVAHEMAREFYDGVFSGMTVADALCHAKTALLEKNSPVGGLYALYGDPDLRIEPS
jgi:CHAT domain-containing protein